MVTQPNSNSLQPIQSDEFLPAISRWTTLGGFCLVGTLGILVTLAALIKYNVTVKAPGTIRPVNELSRIPRSILTSNLMVKAYISPEDIGQVSLGQAVQLRVSAYPYPDYGTLQGRVSAITSDITIPHTQGSQITTPYYEIIIEPDQAYLIKNHHQYWLLPGMEVRADLLAQEETVLTLILRKTKLLLE